MEIKQDGTLMKHGFRNPNYVSMVTEHSDTNIFFEGFKIPYYNDAIKLVKNVHGKFYNMRSIGWNVAITKMKHLTNEANED